MARKFKDIVKTPPPVAAQVVPAANVSEAREPRSIEEFTEQIKGDLGIMGAAADAIRTQRNRLSEARGRIIRSLIKIRDNKEQYLGNRSFQSYIEQELGMSRGHVYETLQAYEVCLKHGRPELYIEGMADTKVLVQISRIESEKRQKQLIEKAEELKRGDVVKRSYKAVLTPKELKPALKELMAGLTDKEKNRIKRELIKELEQM